MAPYFIIFSLLALFALAEAFNLPRKPRIFILFFCFVLLTMFAGLRYGDQDYDNYVKAFGDVSRWGLDYSRMTVADGVEPGYNLLVWVVAFFTHSPEVLFVLVAAIGVGLNLFSYNLYSKYFLIAVLLYFVHTFLLREMIQIRAGVAAGICLYSLRWVGNKQLGKFLTAVALAITFHFASIVFVAVYYFYRKDWGRRVWLWIVVGSLAIAYVMPLGRFLVLLPGGGIQERILVYSWMVDQRHMGILTNPTIAKQLVFVLAGLGCWNILSVKVPNFKLLFTPLVYSLCWLLVWNDFPIIAGRMATFLSVTEVLVVPSFLYLFTPRSRPFAILVFVTYAFATLYLNTLPGSNVWKYQNILF